MTGRAEDITSESFFRVKEIYKQTNEEKPQQEGQA